MNTKLKTRADGEDEDFETTGTPLGFSVKTKSSNNFIVNINTNIRAPEHYSRIFEMLLDSTEEDLVDFFIVSPGGRLDGLSVLLEGIRLTDSYTRAILIGEASSAASILALNCNEVIVTDSAEMLCHHCLYATGGKAADISAHVNHITKVTEKLLRNTYAGFMTESEISMMLQGTQWYFDADQIRERLQSRSEFLEAKYEAEQAEQLAALEAQAEVQPKKPSRKKSPPKE